MDAISRERRDPMPVAGRAAATGATDWADLLARVALAALFLWSGAGKLIHPEGTVQMMAGHGIPMAGMLVWVVALVEVIGGAMLVTGWHARLAALLLAAFTLVAALVFHNFWAVPAEQAMNQQIHFMKNIAIAGGLLHVFACGCGRMAVEKPAGVVVP